MSTGSAGQRQAVTHGRYDEQYKITVPEPLPQNNAPIFEAPERQTARLECTHQQLQKLGLLLDKSPLERPLYYTSQQVHD